VISFPSFVCDSLLLQLEGALGYATYACQLAITNSSITLRTEGSGAITSLLDWAGDVNFVSVALQSSGDVGLISIFKILRADRSTFTWNSASLAKGQFVLTDCKFAGRVTAVEGALLYARNSKFDQELTDGSFAKCDKLTTVGCAEAAACNAADARAALQCWCPHGEQGKSKGEKCTTENATCPPGWQVDTAQAQGKEPCVKCNGLENKYSLYSNSTCLDCPEEGLDCSAGYFRIRVNGGFYLGQPYYMACVSNSTLKTLEMVGVDVVAAKADAMRHMDEQANMGVGLKVLTSWQCSATSTMVSSPARILSDNFGRFHGAARVYPCPNPDACIVRDDGMADCADGYWGLLCGLCQEGHVWSAGHVCKPCTGDTLTWRVGTAFGAGVAVLVALYIFTASPLFENEEGVGPGKRVLAWGSERRACCRPAAPPTSELTELETEQEPPRETSPTPTPAPTGPVGVPKVNVLRRIVILFTTMLNALRAPVKTPQEIFEALARSSFWKRIVEIMACSDEKEGAQARCLIGYSQVRLRGQTGHQMGWNRPAPL
jgi:hypothetical protein